MEMSVPIFTIWLHSLCPHRGDKLILMITSFSGFNETNGKLESIHSFSLVKIEFILNSKGHPESITIHPSQASLCHW